MSTTVLSDEIINIVGQLDKLQIKKRESQDRIKMLEDKLNMAHEARIALNKEEEELEQQLSRHGFYCGSAPLPQPNVMQHNVIQQAPQPAMVHSESNDQLSALLSTLFQQQPPNINPRHENYGGNSGGNSGGGTSYQGSSLGAVISPSSGPSPLLRSSSSTGKVVPTSAPSLTVRRRR